MPPPPGSVPAPSRPSPAAPVASVPPAPVASATAMPVPKSSVTAPFAVESSFPPRRRLSAPSAVREGLLLAVASRDLGSAATSVRDG